MLVELIMNAQSKDENAMVNLIFKFDPLLKKYARKLDHEDAYEDMIVYFIELIHYIDIKRLKNPTDGGIVTYINRAVYNYYCRKVKELIYSRNEIVMSDLSAEQNYMLESRFSTKEKSDFLRELEAEKYLTEKEFATIDLIFIKGYSAEEIAGMKQCSRQSVNQTKKRALKKIASLMDIKMR